MFDKADYTTEGFILPIERDNVRAYASINAVLYRDEDGLDRSGNYFIYLLDPLMGSCTFTLEPGGENNFEAVGEPVWLDDDIVQEIIKAIVMSKVKVSDN